MKKQELIQQLKTNHLEFADYLSQLNESDFLYSPNFQKWSAGQQLEHIVKSVSPLTQAFLLPNFMLSLLFGKANRNSKTYSELIEKYHSKLSLGGVASARFTPKKVELNQRKELLAKLTQLIEKLCKQLDGFSEEQLDKLILPHPLLGKITLREMFYFTIYHVQHHHRLIQENLKNRT